MNNRQKIDEILILGALVALGLSCWRLGDVLGVVWDRLERLLGSNLASKLESWLFKIGVHLKNDRPNCTRLEELCF